MTLKDLPGYLNDLLAEIERDLHDRVLLSGAVALQGEMQQRIFSEGKDSMGNQIGTYSQKPAYFTEDQFVRKEAFEKIGKSGGETIVYDIDTRKKRRVAVTNEFRERKSMFLKRGYAEFREIQGRQSDYKDFHLSGSLRNNLSIGRNGDAHEIGFTDERESLKRKGLEAQVKKDVFAPSESDLEVLDRAISDEVNALKHEL